MLALEIEFLTGRYVATVFNDRKRAEWPPHPARVFSALVATHAEAETKDPTEREALCWLERQEPPEVAASDATAREVVTVFVPVNDTTVARDVEDLGRDLDTAEAALAAARTEVSTADDKQRRGATRSMEQAAKRRDMLGARLAKALGPDAKDTADGIKAATRVLPEHRGRQPRTFPSVTPDRSIVHLLWPRAEPTVSQRDALARLAARVVRIGHSSSLVRCSVVDITPPSSWVPDPEGDEMLRVVKAGQIERLDDDFDEGRTTGARPCAYQRYRATRNERASDMCAKGVFGADWVVLRRVAGARLPSARAVDVATAVRGALMKYADQPPRPILSGHALDGGAGDGPHLAIVPLPFVGTDHADGRILGVALVLPRDTAADDRRHVHRALGAWERARRQDDEEAPVLELQLGATGTLEIERVSQEDGGLRNLQSASWCRPSRRWISATPMALDKNPGKLRSCDPDPARRAETEASAAAEAEAIVSQACVRIGLPEPESVVVLPSVSLVGTEKAVHFPPFPVNPARTRRVKVHAEIVFPTRVQGPVLLGAGRYLGLGLFRPVEEDHDADY